MKLKIPPEFQVGAHIYRIRWSETKLTAAELRGESDYKEQIVRLQPRRSSTQTFETLIHEMIHVVEAIWQVKPDERRTLVQSEGFTQALMSLGIELDFSEIPEEEL